MSPRRALFAGAAALATLSVAQAVVIGFDNITSAPLDPYSGHTEKGFAIEPILGNWVFDPYDGNPVPCIDVSFLNISLTASVGVRRSGGGLFTFQSVWFYFGKYGTYSFDGYRNGTLALHITRDFSDAFGTRFSPSPNQIDSLTITMYQQENAFRRLDTIDVSPVPEPTTETITFAVVGFLALRRRFRAVAA